MDEGHKIFLPNPHDEFGSLAWYVTKRECEDDETNPPPTASACLRFTDCSRAIWFDFHMSSLEDVDVRLLKVDAMLKEITDFRENLVKTKSFLTKKEKLNVQ